MKITAVSLRFLVSCLLFIVSFTIFSIFLFQFSISNVQAQNCNRDQNLNAQGAINKINKCAIEKNVFDDKLFNLNQIAGTTDSLYNLLTGKSQLHSETNGVTANSGALAATSNLVASLYSVPPSSGVQYFAEEIHKFNPVKPAYAQTGIGYNTLSPVKDIWRVFRNISYVGFVIVFVIMGFMIMFRAHISPQAVATVQDSLPRIIIALILVTFSYAIAGLMIDVMFLFLNVAINAIPSSMLSSGDFVFQKSVFGVVMGSWKDIFATVADALSKLIQNLVQLPEGLDKLFGFFGGGIAALVVGIAILFIMFRVFLMLLMAYVMIILLTMAAPFFFLIQALPGNNGAKEWFKQMASNVAVFPTVALMFIFAGIIGGIGDLGGVRSGIIRPEQIGNFPLLAGDINDVNAIGRLIGIGFLLMTPSAAELVKNAIGTKGGPSFGAGAAALGGAAGVASFIPRRVGGEVGGAFRAAGQERQEWLGSRIPFVGGQLQRRRRALGIEKTAGRGGTEEGGPTH